MEKYIVAICQMDSQDDKRENLLTAANMIDEAIKKGAKLIAFPENFNFIGRGFTRQAEDSGGETINFLCDAAREKNIWIMGGSFLENTPNKKNSNTSVLIDDRGNIQCKYQKLHLFDVDLKGGLGYTESSRITAGEKIVIAKTQLGVLGFAICYDLRFPELFRLMAVNGAQVIFAPSCFTYETGRAHWEALLRARAIENAVYVVAPAQTGNKYNMKSYGHSMIVDPWGEVVAQADDEVCCLFAEINLDKIGETRSQIPALYNRRKDIYNLSSNKITINE